MEYDEELEYVPNFWLNKSKSVHYQCRNTKDFYVGQNEYWLDLSASGRELHTEQNVERTAYAWYFDVFV